MNLRVEVEPTVLVIGNPNVGKTSLFNALSRSRAHVGNYPGVTVERRVARVPLPAQEGPVRQMTLVDVPGAYSLAGRSREEQVAISSVLGTEDLPRPQAVIAVVDAAQLARCLYLVLQVAELGVPMVLALNMVDEAGNAAPTPERLEELTGIPTVVTNGRTGAGKEELLARVADITQGNPQHLRLEARYPRPLREAVDRLASALPEAWRGNVERDRALGFWALTSLDEEDELVGIPEALREATARVRREHGDVDLALAAARYRALDELMEALDVGTSEHRMKATERIDRVLLHPVAGLLAFLVTMLVVFQALFSWANPFIEIIEWGVSTSQDLAARVLPGEGLLESLLVDGVIGGVGNVIVFLPQILLLFLFIGILEDSGYMARVAYLMDRIMRGLGLHGRAFVPMLSGFACAVPAIMATRTLERRRDQLLTMMVVPLMTCSARLPVYTLIIGALFPVGSFFGMPIQGLLLIGLYLFSMIVALVAAWVLGRTAIRGQSVPLVIELPPYRLPRIQPTLAMMRRKAGQFLKEAGTVILAATVVLWALLSFPKPSEAEVEAALPSDFASLPSDERQRVSEKVEAALQIQGSVGGQLGQALEPVVRPLGFDWKMTTAIIGAFAAREVFISTLAMVYGIGEVDDEATPLRDHIREQRAQDGTPTYTPLVGLSLLIFFALACQCMSTLAVVKRETQSWRWPAFLFVYMTTLAYGCSFLVYQTGRLLGF